MRVIGLALLSIAVAAPASADKCLNSVNNMIVAYNLPASRGAAVSTQASGPGAMTPGGGEPMRRQDEAMTEEPSSGYERAAPHSQPRPIEAQRDALYQPEVQPVRPLRKAQREQLQDILYQAADAEAAGDNARCMQLLQEAENVANERQAPAKPQRQRR
jgi:hypothetical protein